MPMLLRVWFIVINSDQYSDLPSGNKPTKSKTEVEEEFRYKIIEYHRITVSNDAEGCLYCYKFCLKDSEIIKAICDC